MFEKLIAKTASALDKHKIPYMVIGGQAVLLYGEPRLTKDIDITLGVSVDSLPVVLSAVKEAGLIIIPEDYESFVKRSFVLPLKEEESGIRVDLVFSFTPYERAAIERAREVKMSGAGVRFATLEDVIVHKVFSGRPRDLEDVRSMLLKNPECDFGYIDKWLLEFDNVSEGGEKFTGIFKGIMDSIKP